MTGGKEERISNEQPEIDMHTAGAETSKGEGIGGIDGSLGKFKDVKTLLQSYNSLESEFTKRCKRVKELEGENAKLMEQFKNGTQKETLVGKQETLFEKDKPSDISGDRKDSIEIGEKPTVNDSPHNLSEEEFAKLLYEKANQSTEVREKIVREYLSDILNSKPKAVLLSDSYGGVALTPPKRPTTFTEAGKMAEVILRKKS